MNLNLIPREIWYWLVSHHTSVTLWQPSHKSGACRNKLFHADPWLQQRMLSPSDKYSLVPFNNPNRSNWPLLSVKIFKCREWCMQHLKVLDCCRMSSDWRSTILLTVLDGCHNWWQNIRTLVKYLLNFSD